MVRVLHVARDWVGPSEGFVADVVRTTGGSVAYGRRHGRPLSPVPETDLTRRAGWLPLTGDRALRAALRLTVLQRRPEVLHAHFGYWAHLAGPVARATGRRWTVALHGHDLLVEGDPHGVLPDADLVVVPSRFLADATGSVGIDPARVRVVPSGLDLAALPFHERSARPDGTVVVTFAGRFVAKKGVLDAARALALAHQRVPGLRAVFVGHGPLEQALRAELAASGLPAEVRDGGRTGAVRAALSTTDLVITASRIAPDGDAETLGLVNLEALALGAPLVTTRTGGVPAAVGETAVLVDEGDVDGLAAAVVALAGDPRSWPARGRAGRDHVERRFALADRCAELQHLWSGLP